METAAVWRAGSLAMRRREEKRGSEAGKRNSSAASQKGKVSGILQISGRLWTGGGVIGRSECLYFQ